MSIQLPIDDLIVPAKVQRGYLKNYEPAFLETIEKVYQQVEKEQLSKITDAPTPGASVFVLVAGSHGVGKSHLVGRLTKERANAFVVCDADSIITKFPGFAETAMHAAMSLSGQFNMSMDNVIIEMQEATQRYRDAAKYVNDRLMTRCVREGYPVIFETNAKTPHIGNFLDNLKATGVRLETHICQAPLRVKEAGFERRFAIEHDIGITAAQIRAEHEAMLKNMKVIAQKSDGDLTLHWRQDVRASLKPAAVATAGCYQRDGHAATGFDAYFIDHDLCIAKLMGGRGLQVDLRARPDAAPAVTIV